MMVEYQRRIIDDTLDRFLDGLPAISLEGAKAVGKTATGSRRATTVLSLDNPQVAESVRVNTDVITELDTPVFIDEWQLVPDVWNRVRRAVDDNPRTPGQFLLAGSSTVSPDARIHSGAGRIVSLVMRPLSIAERGIATPTVSLRDLLDANATVQGNTEVRVGDYVDEILASGFPEIRRLEPPLRDPVLDSYLGRIVERDLAELGVAVRRPTALMGWLRAYAAATATTADYNKILDAATPGEGDKPMQQTVTTYREHLTRLFILDPLDAWYPTFSPLKRLTFAPRHHLVDPALAARLVGVGRKGLLLGEGQNVHPTTGTWLGRLFESLVTQSVRVYADSLGAQTSHLRTKGGKQEIDLIVEDSERNCVAIEVKLAGTVSDSDVRHLLWLKRQIGERLKDMVVINTGNFAYRRPDGVAVVPLALLGP